LCCEMGLLATASVDIDGSKFKAVNNRDKNLSAAHRKFSGCVEHYRGVAIEVFVRKFSHVFRYGDFKYTGIPSKLCEDCPRKRYDVVLVAGRIREIENVG